MKLSIKSLLLVTIQMGAIFAILFTGPQFAMEPSYLTMELLGIGVGVWALMAMRRSTFSIMPDVKQDGQLVRHGPYRWIRHPMYLAVLLVTGALVLTVPSPARLLIWVILLSDILIKIAYEEQLLANHYPTYDTYRQQTKRLLPYVY